MKALTILKYAVTLAGLAMLAGAFHLHERTRSFIAEATRAEGTVVDLVRSRTSGSLWGHTYAPVVRFIDHNGRTIEFVSSTGSNPPPYSQGEKVEVLYRPTAPQRAEINGFGSLWTGALLVGGAGAAFFLVGSGIILAGWRKSRRRDSLRKNGIPIEAEFQRVERVTAWSVNGNHPFMVLTQWKDPSTSKVHIFKSDHLWFDPSSQVKGRKITVFMAKDHPGEYAVDLSFLSEPEDQQEAHESVEQNREDPGLMLRTLEIVVRLVKGGFVLAVGSMIAFAFWPDGISARPLSHLTLEEFLRACGSVLFGLFGLVLCLRTLFFDKEVSL